MDRLHPNEKFEECIESALYDIGVELQKARRHHPPLNSDHEAYAVIKEELDEYWEEVRKVSNMRDREAMRAELVQTAAMCVRAIVDLHDRRQA